MLNRGYVMTDCRDRRNFITHNGKTYPVDFGQIYHSTDKYYGMNKGVHEKQIERLTSEVKSASEKLEFSEEFKSLKRHIEELRLYKEKN
ncbi:hypothetical protein, partial [Legionella tunisiensis]|uniref:hypothetical protein n=1 Tax=Legionella tunisiensis TaxID=1034944 RepID=UPI000592B72F